MADPTFFATEADFSRWLAADHETAPELLTSAKKPETRAKRFAILIESSAAGEKIPG